MLEELLEPVVIVEVHGFLVHPEQIPGGIVRIVTVQPRAAVADASRVVPRVVRVELVLPDLGAAVIGIAVLQATV